MKSFIPNVSTNKNAMRERIQRQNEKLRRRQDERNTRKIEFKQDFPEQEPMARENNKKDEVEELYWEEENHGTVD